MEIVRSTPSWFHLLRRHARAHPLTATGLGVALIAVLMLLIQSLILLASGGADAAVRYALLGGLAGLVATACGALPALVVRSIPQRIEDTMLGFAAGMMLAASAFSLLLRGLDAGQRITGSQWLAAAVVVFGMLLGVLLMLGLDELTPHEHERAGPADRDTNAVAAPGCSYSRSRCTICRRAWR